MKLHLLVLLLACTAFYSVNAQTANDFVISGYVYTESDSTPIENYRVIINEPDTNGTGNDLITSVITDANGYYTYTVVNGSINNINRNYRVFIADGCGAYEKEVTAPNLNGASNIFSHSFYTCLIETCSPQFSYLTKKNNNGTYDVYIYSTNDVPDTASLSYEIPGYGTQAGNEPAIFTAVLPGYYTFDVYMTGSSCNYPHSQNHIFVPKYDIADCIPTFTSFFDAANDRLTLNAMATDTLLHDWWSLRIIVDGHEYYLPGLAINSNTQIINNLPYGEYDMIAGHTVGGPGIRYLVDSVETLHINNTDGTDCDAHFLRSTISNLGTPTIYHCFGVNTPGLNHVWLYGTDTISTTSSCNTFYLTPFSIQHIVYNNSGCFATETDTIGNMQTLNYCQVLFNLHPLYNTPDPYDYRFATEASNFLTQTWTVDGNTISNDFIFNYSFGDSLPHEVCLTVNNGTSCSDSICTIVTANNNLLTGLVGYQDTLCGGCINDATVYLYEVMMGDTSAIAVFIDSAAVTNGEYQFDHLPNGEYIVRAALNPTNPEYANYLPTYSSVFEDWHDAASFSQYLTGVHYGYNTDLGINLLAVSLNPGSGLIGGWVIVTDTLRSSSAEGVVVYIKNQAGQIAKYDICDVSGMFELPDLAYGTYTLYADYPGYTCVPQVITIDSLNSTVLDIEIVLNITPATPTTATETTSSFTIGNPYPNPTEGNITLPITANKTSQLAITIYNLLGQPVLSQNNAVDIGNQLINLNTDGFAQGIYILQMTDKKTGTVVTKKIVKD